MNLTRADDLPFLFLAVNRPILKSIAIGLLSRIRCQSRSGIMRYDEPAWFCMAIKRRLLNWDFLIENIRMDAGLSAIFCGFRMAFVSRSVLCGPGYAGHQQPQL